MGLLSTIGAASGRAFGFTRSAIAQAVDAYFNRVTLLLPGNGTNGAQNNTFLDSSSNNFTITRNGNTTQGTFSPFSQTGWGNYFDGNGDYLSIADNAAFTMGSGDFTIEYWAYVPAYSDMRAYGQVNSVPDGNTISFFGGINGSNKAYSGVRNGTTEYACISTANFPLNQWVHHVLVRDGTTLRQYINGVQDGTAAVSTISINDSANQLAIGRVGEYNALYWNGYISNFRIVKGTCLYPSGTTFTPPTAALTAVSGTSLLACQSNRFIDNSSNNFTITRNGDVSVQAFSPFAPTAAYSAATNGGSGYFDGSGDSLVMATASAAINPSTSTTPFTIECWVYNTGTSSTVLYGALGSENYGFVLGFGSSVGTYDSTQTPWFGFYTGGWSGIRSTTSIPRNAWTHLACVFTGSTSYIYQDGVMRASGGAATWGVTGSSKVRIGYRVDGPETFTGYISGARVVIGSNLYPGGTTFTPPTAPPTAITNTSLLLNFTNAGITDATGKSVIETVGTAQISTAQSKWGGSSILFDGAATPEDKLIIPISALQLIGTSDFTFECWVRPQNVSTLQTLITYGTGAFRIFINSTNVWFLNGASSIINANGSFTANNWFHVAVARKGSTGNNTACWVNGTRIAAPVANTSDFNSGTTIQIGGEGTSNLLQGYLQDVRLTEFARYDPANSTITVPTAAFPLQ